MKIVKEGEQTQVVCHNCGLSNATYQLRDLEFSDNSGLVKNLLAAVCVSCGEVASIPAQSSEQIRAELDKQKQPIDVRLPAHYLDILAVASQKIDVSLSASFAKPLLLYYLHALSTGRFDASGLQKALKSDVAKAKSSKRISMKLSNKAMQEVTNLMETQGLANNTEVFKSIILRIHHDLVMQAEPPNLKELKNFAAAFV